MKTVKPVREHYLESVVPALTEEFGYTSPMQVPKLVKIVLNVGLGEALGNAKALEFASADLAVMAGQRPVITKARKSIATFKLREGNPIGVMVTLRGQRMYDFYTRLVRIALPRTRDFRGVSPSAFDGRGNYTLGIRDHLIFQEIDFNKVDKSKGMNVTFVTTAENDEQALHLLRELGMPFVRG